MGMRQKKSLRLLIFLLALWTFSPASQAAPVCGNAIAQAGEACDNANVNGYSCTSLSGFNAGELGCKQDCLGYDTSACIAANTLTAASPSFQDVNAAVSKSNSGDIVIIPAGTATWNSTLMITKAITLKGGGIDNTKIINGGINQLIRIKPQSQSEAGKNIRITGIYFYYPVTPVYSTGGERRFILVEGRQDGAYPLTQLRIDHSKFEKGFSQIFVDGWVYGVIDHSEFLNANISVRLNGEGTLSWERPIQAGTSSALFIEDNNFVINNDIDTIDINRNADSMIYQGAGARSVTRYNSFDATAFTPSYNALNPQFYDSHGNQRYYEPNWSVGHQRGQPIIEIYNNKFNTYKATANLFQIRGGSSLVFNNEFKAIAMSRSSSVPYFYEEECGAISSFPALRAQWPAEDAHRNTFIWNNTCNWTGGTGNCAGNQITDAYVGGCSTTFVQKDRDYFMHEPQATGGQSLYTGRIGASNTSPTNGSPGTMIFDPTAPNAYYPYTQFTYPHPLITLDNYSQQTTPPTATITSPANGATFSAPAAISITATAGDSDGSVSKVEFFNGAALLGTDTADPYTYNWSGVGAGTYSMSARATDNSGAATTSSPIIIIVGQQGAQLLDDDLDTVPNAQDRCPKTAAAARLFVNRLGCAMPIATKFDIKPDFNATDINGMQNLEIGISNIGKISYTNRGLQLLKIVNREDDRLDLDSSLSISQGKIELNQNTLPQLNYPATITLYNIDFNSPKILVGRIECQGCTMQSYNKSAKTLVFTVPGF